MQEPFSTTRDEQHPVRWSPADGDTPAYLTLKGAVERLSRWFGDTEEIAAGLKRGQVFRTDFAFYKVDDVEGDR
jgi:hypothetical protein